jgi:hypothetical protein
MDPVLGRFTSEDPLGAKPLARDFNKITAGNEGGCGKDGKIKPFAAGDFNLSRYTFNSPTKYRDPRGLTTAVAEYGTLQKHIMGLGALGFLLSNSSQNCHLVVEYKVVIGDNEDSPVFWACWYICPPSNIPLPVYIPVAEGGCPETMSPGMVR